MKINSDRQFKTPREFLQIAKSEGGLYSAMNNLMLKVSDISQDDKRFRIYIRQYQDMLDELVDLESEIYCEFFADEE